MHIDYAKIKFYLKSQKKKSQIIFEHFYILYGDSPHSTEPESLSIFQISSIFSDYGGWVWKNKIKETYFIFHIKYYKFKSEFNIMLFKILITWHHIT